LDAALKGTISSYTSRDVASDSHKDLLDDSGPSSWFFDIHEDTPEQEMTNLLQHSTCVLDISSDEESEQRARREKAEGRDKENIPPVDDVSQTRARGMLDEMMVEKSRDPLSQLNTADFYAAGCDEASVILVPADEDDVGVDCSHDSGLDLGDNTVMTVTHPDADITSVSLAPEPVTFEFSPVKVDFDELMDKDEKSSKAAVLAPIEGTGESFDLWESGSAKDELEPATAPSPAAC